MRVSLIAPLTLICICASSLAQAAPKQNPQEVVRYILISSILGDLEGDAILKERRQGGRLIAADLDVCHAVSETSMRRDRFVMPLKVEGNRLTGSAQSQEDKLPVTVNLTRKVASDLFAFEGTISRGGQSIKVASTDNTDMSEAEFKDSQGGDTEILDKPADFTAHSPQSLVVRAVRASMATVVAGLRDQNVKLAVDGLVADCNVLRSGNHELNLEIDPERASALLAKLKAMPGVSAAGYASATSTPDVRFAASGWRAGDKLDRDKLAQTLGAVAAKVFAAQPSSSAWDATIGELSVKLKRPAKSVPAALGLTEIITVSVLVGPETPSSNARLLLWVERVDSDITDEGTGPRLTFTPGGDRENSKGPEGLDNLVAAIAAELRGETWDSDSSRWKR